MKDRFLNLVNQATQACKQDNYPLASKLYSQAIELDESNHVLFSNRSAAYVRCGEYYLALQDANQTIKLNPTWPKVQLYIDTYFY